MSGGDALRRGAVRNVVLASTSRAEDAGYRATADVAAIAATLDAEYRLVGGQMTALLVMAFGATNAPSRATADADMGTLPGIIGDPRLV